MPARCREHLQAAGVDLGAYTTADVAADVVDLASVLKYPQINLIGNSYGTKVALAIVRDHPALIRSVVLDSSVPPEVRTFESVPATVDRAFQALFAACAADTGCAQRYPHLDQQLDTALRGVEQLPPELVLRAPSGQVTKLSLTRPLFLGMLVSAFAPPLLPALPALIADAAQRNFDALTLLVERTQQRRPGGNGFGVSQAVQCSEEIPFSTAESSRRVRSAHPRFADLSTFDRQAALCAQWPRAVRSPSIREPVSTTVPVLFLSGEFDPIVSPSWVEAARRTIPNSVHLVFPNAGHGALHVSCGWRVAATFISAPAELPVDECFQKQAVPHFEASAFEVVERAIAQARFGGKPTD